MHKGCLVPATRIDAPVGGTDVLSVQILLPGPHGHDSPLGIKITPTGVPAAQNPGANPK